MLLATCVVTFLFRTLLAESNRWYLIDIFFDGTGCLNLAMYDSFLLNVL